MSIMNGPEVCFKGILIIKVLLILYVQTKHKHTKHTFKRISTCLSRLQLSGAVKVNVLFQI